MTEIIRPEFICDPEGIFRFTIDLASENDHPTQRLEKLEAQGMTVEEKEGIATASVQMHDFLKTADNTAISSLIHCLRTSGSELHATDPTTDPVASLSILDEANVHTHFQRWAQSSNPLDEEAGREALEAMDVAFGSRQNFRKSLHFNRGSEYGVRGNFFEVRFTKRQFRFYKNGESGSISLFAPLIRTHGDATEWHVSGSEAIDDTTNNKLYSLMSHNIDTPRQHMSLMLGMATLARVAAQYEGTEDIFAVE